MQDILSHREEEYRYNDDLSIKLPLLQSQTAGQHTVEDAYSPFNARLTVLVVNLIIPCGTHQVHIGLLHSKQILLGLNDILIDIPLNFLESIRFIKLSVPPLTKICPKLLQFFFSGLALIFGSSCLALNLIRSVLNLF